MTALHPLTQALIDLKEEQVFAQIEALKNEGVAASEILNFCHEGMTALGNRFDQGDCFLPELIVAGKIMSQASKELEPLIKEEAQSSKSSGCVVMGTVQNDIHNIGKDIVIMMLRGAGYDVIDLGINVPPQQFTAAIQEHKPIAVGMSILITTCYKSVEQTMKAIESAGLRSDTKIMLGGAAATDLLAERMQCDFYGKSPIDAVNYLNTLTS